ncbi:MAG TPA: DUF4446 family protein [Thermoleophilia bacterium]|nr:DUF4446 family protein [Thermoleophilia bacterium]
MSATQAFEIIAVVAIVVAIAAGIGLALVFRRLQQYQRSQYVIMGSRGTVDIVEHVSAMDDKLANMRLALEDLTLAARDHDVRIDSCLSRVGIVRFDAYQDLGGRQSTAVAFLNSLSDGVVVTTVVSRDFARMYVKLLKDGVEDIPLAPEEAEAVEQAKGSRPFTIRPRAEGGLPDQLLSEGGMTAVAPDEPVSLGLPGRRPRSDRELARENRRRKRRGLRPLEEEVVPSAVGWRDSRTPVPPSARDASLAEQYLSERRELLKRSGDDGGPEPEREGSEEPDEL